MNKSLFLILIAFLLICILLIKLKGTTTKTTPPIYNGTYVALGDSVSAGIGLLGNSDSSACDRSNQSYPNVIAQRLHYKLKNLSCSGATMQAGILGSQNVNDLQETPQLQALFMQPKPQLITITIGANDLQWINLLGACYKGECGTIADMTTIEKNITTVKTNLQNVLNAIKMHYGNSTPKVIVTGYYSLFPLTPQSSCSNLQGIDTTELIWIRQLQSNLNSALQTTVNQSGFATYIPVNFSGHELCTNNPWVQGLNDSEPFHPTAQGQNQYAKVIINSVEK